MTNKVNSCLVVALFLAGTSSPLWAQTGTISGTVTNAATGSPVANVTVEIYGSAGESAGSGSTDAQGVYTSTGLPTGSYFVRTSAPSSSGLLDELYNNIPCVSGNCTVTTGTAVAVTASNTTGNINFALAPGGRISGAVTDAVTGSPVANVYVGIYSSAAGDYLGSGSTNAQGVYTSSGLPTGSYFVHTLAPGSSGLLDELYNNIFCVYWNCAVTTGTAVAVTAPHTTANIDFALTSGGRISGTVTNAVTGSPVANVSVEIYSSAGDYVGYGSTDAQGVYLSSGLPTGSYFVRTSAPGSSGLLDELYNNILCVSGNCTVTTGTAVAVTAPNTIGNVDFALTPGGRISGTVTNAATVSPVANVYVGIYDSAGDYAGSGFTNAQGVYTSPGLPTGSYFVRTSAPGSSGLLDELYNNILCVGGNCTVTTGTAVAVAAPNTTGNVDFALTPGGRISGTVTNAVTGSPVANVFVEIHSSAGNPAGSGSTDAQGVYTSTGLPTGSYFVRTSAPIAAGLLDELYDNILCVGGNCTVTTGTAVAVTAPNTTGNIDFALAPGGRISGTVTNAATGSPVANVYVEIFSSAGNAIGSGYTNGQGIYTSSDLPTGSYFVRTSAPASAGFLDELYNNLPCVGGNCTVTAGTAVAVAAPSTTTNINFALTPIAARTGDTDGDGKADIAVFRPSNGVWYVVPSGTGVPYGVQWGNGNDRIVPADYDGDGRTDIAVFRPSDGVWYVLPSSTGVAYGVQWGNANDRTVPADYDGDGKTDIAVFRPSNGVWYVLPSSTGVPYGVQWGNGNDIPLTLQGG